jgi:aconitate hydratase
MSIYDAAMKYVAERTPLIVIAGAEYGTAARATGRRRERCCSGSGRSSPRASSASTEQPGGDGRAAAPAGGRRGRLDAGPDGKETFDIGGVADGLTPGKRVTVKATGEQGTKEFTVTCRIDTPNELDYYRNGGILRSCSGSWRRADGHPDVFARTGVVFPEGAKGWLSLQ